MKKEQNNERKWLEGAYSHFADVGSEQLNIKKISEFTGLPRKNFYYHFPDKNVLLTQLLNFHVGLSKKFEEENQSELIALFELFNKSKATKKNSIPQLEDQKEIRGNLIPINFKP